MNYKSVLRTAAFLAVIIALLVGAVGVAYAATSTKSVCYTQYDGGARAAKVCLKTYFEYSGNIVRCKMAWSNKYIYKSGWSIRTYVAPKCTFTGHTTGWARAVGKFDFKKNGYWVNSADCSIRCNASGGNLYCIKVCY